MKNLATYAYGHHEKLNGSGYPRHLTGDDIPIQTRLITIADMFDALTASDRPYKPAVTADKALDILRSQAEAGLLDSDLVRVMTESRSYQLVETSCARAVVFEFVIIASLATWMTVAAATLSDTTAVIRVNQVGYLPDAPKVAVLCALTSAPPDRFSRFTVVDDRGRTVFGPAQTRASGSFGPCASTWRLDFTALRRAGRYVVASNDVRSSEIRIGASVYAGGADTLLTYMREQRSGFNPFFRDSVHRLDGNVIDDSGHVVKFQPVSGGWADASDYLQYVATSATATYHMLLAFRDHPSAFTDKFAANGLAGANRVPDVLDEARHGIEWLVRMFPSDTELYNQLGDDRDHTYFDLPTTDSADYGWGKGKERPVYPCTGRPQGIFQFKNRSDGFGFYGGEVCVGVRARIARVRDARSGTRPRASPKGRSGVSTRTCSRPGVCQTAPGRAPYFYEEDNWTDDMELAAAELYALTRDERYRRDAREYAAKEPVTPWMGADTARHYQWYPWHNAGHYALWRNGLAQDRATTAAYYRRGIEAVVGRATNGFRVGIPFIWCSNDLMVSFATQALSLSADDGRRPISRIRTSRNRLAVRRESVGRLDGRRVSARRTVAARPAFRCVGAIWPGGADGRTCRRSRVPVDLHEPARHRPATRRRLRCVQHRIHRVSRRPRRLLDERADHGRHGQPHLLAVRARPDGQGAQIVFHVFAG